MGGKGLVIIPQIHCIQPAFAIITSNNLWKLEKPCITNGLATCQSLGLMTSHCNVGAYGGPWLKCVFLENLPSLLMLGKSLDKRCTQKR